MSEKSGYTSASGITVDLRDIRRAVNDVYYSLLSNYDRYLVLYGSAGSGKSHFAAQKILFRILLGMEHGVTHTFLVLRKTAPAARKSLIALFRHYISEWGLGRLVRYNKGDMVFEFVNGARILAGGLDDPEKIKSIEGLTGAWLEEATEFNEQDFMQVDLRLRGRVATYKQIMLTFNPTDRRSWLHRKFFEDEHNSATVVRTTYRDNRFIDDEYATILASLREQDEMYYQVYALGEWGVPENIILTRWRVGAMPQTEESYDMVTAGLDFGFNHPSALLRVGVRDGDLYVFQEVYERGLTNNELICCLRELTPPMTETIVADSAEPDRIREFRQAGFSIVPSRKGPGSVRDGIDFLKRRTIHIHPGCINTIREIQNWKYREDGSGVLLDEPVPFMDDAMAALRYAVEPLRIRHTVTAGPSLL